MFQRFAGFGRDFYLCRVILLVLQVHVHGAPKPGDLQDRTINNNECCFILDTGISALPSRQ
ncbi:MAG: hypothetical protein CL799_09065 [Chromatiales bacterium]|nr:hypothetical protein [Chromatiales bacterium]